MLGFDVFTQRPFSQGEFLLDYAGELIGSDEADSRDDQTFIYYFSIGSKRYR